MSDTTQRENGGEGLLDGWLKCFRRDLAEEFGHVAEEGRALLGVPEEVEEVDAVGLQPREDLF